MAAPSTRASSTTQPSARPLPYSSPVVTIGDSITFGHGLDPSAAWPALLENDTGWSVTNLGCDGAGFDTDGDGYCGSSFAGLVSAAAKIQPKLVIIQGSSNDLGNDDDKLLSATVTTFYELHAAVPRAEIVGLSSIWGDTAPPAQLQVIDDQVKQSVERVGGIYLETGQPLSGHPELMQADHIHPTAAGQRVLATAIEHALISIGILPH